MKTMKQKAWILITLGKYIHSESIPSVWTSFQKPPEEIEVQDVPPPKIDII